MVCGAMKHLLPLGLVLLGCGASPDLVEDPPPPQPALDDPRAHDRRGDEHLRAGRVERAIEDFDRFLDAYPEAEPYHWRRGIAYYYAGRYDDGVRQFEMHRTVNPADVENAAWHFLCKARASDPEQARAALLPVGHDRRAPMMTVYELFAGRATCEDVLVAAGENPGARFYAHLYLGLYHEALGDPAAARPHLEAAATTDGQDHYMGDVARVHWAGIQ